jgi:hypothetical protein
VPTSERLASAVGLARVSAEREGAQRDAMPTMLIRGVASAPLTFAWLFVLLVTIRAPRSAGRWGWRRIQRHHSTNLRRLGTEPHRVLTTSLFWLDDRKWWPYVPLFVLIVAPRTAVALVALAFGRRRGARHCDVRQPRIFALAHPVGQGAEAAGECPRRRGELLRHRSDGGVVGAGRAAVAVTMPSGSVAGVGHQRCGDADLHVGHLTAFGVGLAGDRARPHGVGLAPGVDDV